MTVGPIDASGASVRHGGTGIVAQEEGLTSLGEEGDDIRRCNAILVPFPFSAMARTGRQGSGDSTKREQSPAVGRDPNRPPAGRRA